MSKQPLRCIHCGQQFPRIAGAGLCCGDDCAKQHEAAREQIRKDLSAGGFTQNAETPNLWTKDGVSITEEHVKHAGMAVAMQQHASHAAGVSQ